MRTDRGFPNEDRRARRRINTTAADSDGRHNFSPFALGCIALGPVYVTDRFMFLSPRLSLRAGQGHRSIRALLHWAIGRRTGLEDSRVQRLGRCRPLVSNRARLFCCADHLQGDTPILIYRVERLESTVAAVACSRLDGRERSIRGPEWPLLHLSLTQWACGWPFTKTSGRKWTKNLPVALTARIEHTQSRKKLRCATN